MPESTVRLDALRQRALDVLGANTTTVAGHSYVRPGTLVPECQALWDSCLHAIIHLALEPERAKAELRSALAHQWTEGPDAGLIPHLTYWPGGGEALWGRRHTSAITQPPGLAYSVWRTALATGDLSFIRETFSRLDAYYTWLLRRRDHDDDGLVSILHPWESGWDASPRWDEALARATGLEVASGDPAQLDLAHRKLVELLVEREFDLDRVVADGGFHVEPVDFNALLAKNLEAMGHLAGLIRENGAARAYRDRADRTRDALDQRSWSEADGFYLDLDGEDEVPIRRLTPAAFVTLFAGVPDRARSERLVAHLDDPREFWSPYPLPTVAVGDPAFAPDRAWRGSTCVPINWLVIKGLADYGFRDTARELAERTIELVETTGFCATFNPLDGAGHGPKDQSWSALVVDLALLFPG